MLLSHLGMARRWTSIGWRRDFVLWSVMSQILLAKCSPGVELWKILGTHPISALNSDV